jgi:hypothetical protein
MKCKVIILTTVFVMVALPSMCWAQDEQPNIDTAIAMMRTGMQADRDTLISTSMSLNEKEAAAFWPIYRKYEYERSTLDDRRFAVIKLYARNYPNFSDADAKDMAERMFNCESSIAALKKKYFREFNKVLPALTVAKFFQMDHRVDILMDMKVEASLAALDQPQKPAQEQQEQ